MARIRIDGLCKRFGGVDAVAELSIDIPDGAFAAFLGPSGCGKTTTLRMVAGLEQPTSGVIRIGDRTVFGPGVHIPTEQRRIGMVFQSYAVWPHMTVFENVAFPLRVARTPRREIAARVEKALATVRLEGFAGRYPAQLSGGQQQRVALARAIVGEPQLLLLDEPLSNLDAKLRDEMRDEIRDLQRRLGVTTLFVTHDQIEALALSDMVFVMDGGRLQQAGTPREINEHPANSFVANFVGWSNRLPVTPAGAGQLHLAGHQIACDPAALPQTGGALILAIRPEDVQVTPADPLPEGTLPGTVDSVTYLGTHLACRLRVGPHALLAHLPRAADLSPGQPVAVHLPAERIRILAA